MYKYGKIASKRGLFEMKGNYCSLNKNSLTLEKKLKENLKKIF